MRALKFFLLLSTKSWMILCIGLIHLRYLEKGKTINHELYIEECLKPIVKILKNERPIGGAKNMKFHHDNARPHIHKNVLEYLRKIPNDAPSPLFARPSTLLRTV